MLLTRFYPHPAYRGAMARSTGPVSPRVSAPDLPDRLDDGPPPVRSADLARIRWSALDARTDAAHATLSECVISESRLERLDLTGATLVDVEIGDVRATEIVARSARLRRVRISGGRIGTLDLADADLDEVELRGVRIDYLSLAAARISDVLIADCTVVTLDLPHASVDRLAFADARADEVDVRGLRAENLDLRGLEALSYTDPAALRGATLSLRQAEQLAPALAAALGIRLA